MSKPEEKFDEVLCEPNWWQAGPRDRECSGEGRFCGSSYALGMKERTEGRKREGGRKRGGRTSPAVLEDNQNSLLPGRGFASDGVWQQGYVRHFRGERT